MTQTVKDSRLIAFSILAYIFSFFSWQLPLILVVAYALAIAKDDVLSKQSLQALYLYIGYTIAVTAVGWGFTALTWFFSLVRAFGFVSFLASAQSVVMFLIGALLLLLVLIAILKLMKGEAPDLPLIGRLAELTLGIAKPKEKKSYAAPAAQTASQSQTQQPPAQAAPPAHTHTQPSAQAEPPPAQKPPEAPSTPATPPPVQPTPPPAEPEQPKEEDKPAQPEKPRTWTCSCGRENKGNFCVACGKPKA